MEHHHSHNHARGNYKFVIFIFLIVFHFALFYSLSLEPVNMRDSQEYINSSINYKNYDNFYAGELGENNDFRLFGKRTPFYPLVLFVFNKLNLSLNLVFILQIFIALFNIYLTIKLLQYLSNYQRKPLYFFTFFVLFTPSLYIYCLVVMADIWLQFFVTICFWSFAEFTKTKHSHWIVLLIIASTFAALTKPVFLIFSIVIAVWSCFYFLAKSRNKILFLVSLVPIISWYIISNQNQKTTGVFHYSSIGYINLLHYNTNLFLNNTIGKPETEKLLSPLMAVPASKEEFEKNYKEVKHVCSAQILKHPFRYTIFHLKGVVYFFVDPGRFDIYSFLRIEKNESDGFLHNGIKITKIKSIFQQEPLIFLSLIVVFFINIIKTIGFICFVWISRNNAIVLVGAAIVFYVALLTGPLGASRFCLPVQLIISSFAAIFYYLKLFRKNSLHPPEIV